MVDFYREFLGVADSRISLLGFLKQTHQQRRVFFEIKKSKKSESLMSELRNTLMIYGYTLESKYEKSIVYLNYYRNRPSIRGLSIDSRPGHRRFITVRNLGFYFNKRGAAGSIAYTQTSSNKKITSIFNEDHKSKTNHRSKCFGEILCSMW